MVYRYAIDQKYAAKRHYEANKSEYLKRAKAHNKAERLRIKAFVAEYLSKHPCIDCGEADPVVLEFDHRDPKHKRFCIAETGNKSLPNVKREIAKCDVRCANCHRRRTARQHADGEFQAPSAVSAEVELPLFAYRRLPLL